jgi:hypothetical protein
MTGHVSDAFGAMAIAALDGAATEEFAVRKALAAWANGIRNQMILLSLKEFALAASLAATGFGAAAAAPHVAAGGMAAGAAVLAGTLGAVVGASIPSRGGAGAGGAGTDSGGAGTGPAGSGGSRSNDSTVPVSRPAEGVPTPRSNGGSTGRSPFAGATFNVLGGTSQQVGVALIKIQRQAERAEGRFAS